MEDSAQATNLGRVSLLGLTALLLGLIIALGSFQPIFGASTGNSAYLTGSWMLTLNPPQADPSTQACIFSPNLTAAEPQGTVLCTSVQLPVMEGRGKQAANTVGSWNRTSNGTYEMRAVRMVYNENAKVLSRTVALAELQYASEDGTRILKGTGKVIAESPQGKTLQTIPDIELRAEPMTGLSEYDIP